MKVTVNGRELLLEERGDVKALLDRLGLSDKRVAVELNRAIIPRDGYTGTSLKEGDILEIISFVGGG